MISSSILNNTLNNEENITKIFHWIFAFVGGVIFLYSLVNFPYSQMGANFAIISILTLSLGSRIAIEFSDFKSNLSITDIFLYLIAILYGLEAATFLAAIEAYLTSMRFTKRLEFRAFNAGIISVSIFISYKISALFFAPLPSLILEGYTINLLGAMVLMITLHYLINTSIVAISTALRTRKDYFETWRKYYVWMIIPFFASGAVALVAANIIQTSGFYAFLIILPFIAVIYFSYRTQSEKLQALTEQSRQTENHLVEMKESEERFRSAFSNAPIGIGIISNEGKWLQANESFCKIFGFTEEEILSKTLRETVHPAHLVDFLTNIGYVIQGKQKIFQAELRYFNIDGNEIWTQTSISRLNDSENSRLICQIEDITARRQAEEKLRYNACYDSLTGLSNRAVFLEELQNSIARAKKDDGYRFAVIFVDLDKFKLVNDSIGHTTGDKLLMAVANRLRNYLSADCKLARFGSDEFLILIDCHIERENLTVLVEEIQRQVSLYYGISGQEINITASIGIVHYDESHLTEEDILRDADTALNIAKKQGRARYVFFDEKTRAEALTQMQLENDLKRVVERGELFLTYQPIISLSDTKIAGFEALVRWNHPQIGLVSPADFIPIAEESGSIVNIGRFVLDEACRQLGLWHNTFSGELPLTMSINVSTKQLLQKQFLIEVMEVLEKYKLKPNWIKLEITESVVVENSEKVIAILKQFRAMGVKLSMDDFGTGYSSLSYVHKLPINTLKIDRSFVSQMHEKTESAEIVKTIILLAKTLKLDLIAEGIETAEQHQTLTDLGCEFGQGYYFSKPLNVEDAENFIAASLETFDKTYTETFQEDSTLQFEN